MRSHGDVGYCGNIRNRILMGQFMAQKVNIVLVDDIDESEADETVIFGLDGKEYSIDLSARNAGKLRDALALYIGHARKGGGRGGRRSARSAGGTAASEIRDWARGNGYDVSERGRVSAEVREAYNAAH
ncbi:MAG: hypothetical protein JWR35_1541 [Marmoricola sp.]|jgi:hypothetical protein|nr:hypothetical protein [Marmoricola sp.]